ncbi:hypothetical protein D3C79_649430 [compost metagenome]
MHFTVAGHCRERHAVEVVAHDALTRLGGIGAALIGAHAGGNHLADFLRTGNRQAIGRVAVFFQLRGQGTAPRRLPRQGQVLGDLAVGGLGEAWPVHRRVVLWVFRVEQVAVLDEQQAVDDDRRDRREVRVQVLRVVVLVERVATAIGNRQPGLDLLDIGGEQAVIDVVHQGWRELHLFADQVVALEQARQEFAQCAVAQALVERPFAGIDDGIAGARLQRISQGSRQPAELPRLQVGGAEFVIGGKTDGDDRHQQDQEDQPPPEPTLTW